MRTSKVGSDHYEIITAFELDGQTPITGLTASDFTVAVFRNGVAESITPTITEISGGHYLVKFTGGFSTVGYRMVTVIIQETGVTQRFDLEVSRYTIDDVYTVASGSGASSGVNAVTFTLQDSDNSNIAVPSLKVYVYNSANNFVVSFGTTDENGKVVINLDPGSYIVKTFGIGYTSYNQALTVTDTATQNVTISVGSVLVDPPAPATPALCRLFMDFIDLQGNPEKGEDIIVSVILSDTGAGVIVRETTTYTSNTAGRITFDAVQQSYIEVTITGSLARRTVQVPSASTQDLAALLNIHDSKELPSGQFSVVN